MTLEARLRSRARALRSTGITLAQTAVAAGLAWFLAHDVVGHKSAFFAPVAAVIALGIAPGGRTRRTAEMVIGVALGIAVGELLIRVIGTGAAQVGLVVLLAMAGAILLGGGPLIASQAASSAVLVATVRGSSGGVVPSRFVDALIGGGVGIAVLVIVPRDPAAMARRATAPVVRELAGTLDAVAAAIDEHDLEAVRRALERARGIDPLVARLHEALVLAGETTRLAPGHWRERGRIGRYEDAADHLDFAVRNTRVLVRAAVRAVELEPRVSPDLTAAIRGLAGATRDIAVELDTGEGERLLRDGAIDAAAQASSALDEERGFAIDVLVGQVRSLAVDLLRASGLDQQTAIDAVRAAAGERGTIAPRSRPAPSTRGTGRGSA